MAHKKTDSNRVGASPVTISLLPTLPVIGAATTAASATVLTQSRNNNKSIERMEVHTNQENRVSVDRKRSSVIFAPGFLTTLQAESMIESNEKVGKFVQSLKANILSSENGALDLLEVAEENPDYVDQVAENQTEGGIEDRELEEIEEDLNGYIQYDGQGEYFSNLQEEEKLEDLLNQPVVDEDHFFDQDHEYEQSAEYAIPDYLSEKSGDLSPASRKNKNRRSIESLSSQNRQSLHRQSQDSTINDKKPPPPPPPAKKIASALSTDVLAGIKAGAILKRVEGDEVRVVDVRSKLLSSIKDGNKNLRSVQVASKKTNTVMQNAAVAAILANRAFIAGSDSDSDSDSDDSFFDD